MLSPHNLAGSEDHIMFYDFKKENCANEALLNIQEVHGKYVQHL